MLTHLKSQLCTLTLGVFLSPMNGVAHRHLKTFALETCSVFRQNDCVSGQQFGLRWWWWWSWSWWWQWWWWWCWASWGLDARPAFQRVASHSALFSAAASPPPHPHLVYIYYCISCANHIFAAEKSTFFTQIRAKNFGCSRRWWPTTLLLASHR